MAIADVEDFRKQARRRLPRFLFDYIDGGAYSETTLQRNTADLRRIELRQRVMRDVSTIRLETQLFGREARLPVALGPVGLAGLYARRGEVQAARAAQAAGVPFTLSTVSLCSIEEVVEAVGPDIWLQLYVIRDRAFMRDLLARAAGAGVRTLFLTVDLPVNGARYRDVRSGLIGGRGWVAHARRMLEVARRPRWAWDVGVRGRPHALGNVATAMPDADLFAFFDWVAANFDASVTWKDLDWIRSVWPGRIVLKGVLDPDDASEALRCGADGLVVSNHGGRQLDGAPSAIAALSAVVEQTDGRAPVLMDSGVRSGLDVLRCLALGAQGVMLGRAWAYALAADGERGVATMLEILRRELHVAMALSGQTDVTTVAREVLTQNSGGAH
jgi:L-lactate dehydrogenase (cytochrome)